MNNWADLSQLAEYKNTIRYNPIVNFMFLCLLLVHCNDKAVHGYHICFCHWSPLSSTWPHLNSDVGLEKGEY